MISPDIGPRITHSIYKSGPLSAMTNSVEFTRSQDLSPGYLTKSYEFDIDVGINSNESSNDGNKGYVTREFEFDN
ncbi:unnamed protein product [Rhizophagus irregularis]|nr:unnamed protein product [Rhizophagus irregularis]